MPRPRKALSDQKGDLTRKKRNLIDAQSKFASYGRTSEFDNLPDWLIDDRARKEFRRLAKEMQEMDLFSNLEYNALAEYCNEFTQYVAIVNRIKKEPLMHDGMVNEERTKLENKMLKHIDAMRKLGDRCGIGISSRLKFADIKVKKEDEGLEVKFGGI